MYSPSGTSVVEVTPTITASAAYVSGDQVGGIQTISAISISQGLIATLSSIVIVDKSKQNAPLSVFFYDSLPTVVSVDHAAVNVAAAQQLKCVGCITIAALDYQDVGTPSVATKLLANCELKMQTKDPSRNFYVVVKTTGTPTYGSTSDLVFKYVFARDL